MIDIGVTHETNPPRFGTILDKAEAIYLRILRTLILVIATVLILYASWLALVSVYNISKDADSVVEKTASVTADEIVVAEPAKEDSANPDEKKPKIAPEQQKYYEQFVERYYGLFTKSFELFKQPEDKKLDLEQFDDTFIRSDSRIDAVASGDLNFEEDKAELEALLAVMTEAAAMPETLARLKKYQVAKRVQVTRQVQKYRTIRRRGWDSNSVSCEDWWRSPVGCPVTRTSTIPYMETVKSMEFPKGTQSHTEIFTSFQDKYFSLLNERRQTNAADAQQERESIIEGNAKGKADLFTVLLIIASFMVLMFFFLLIAIERHQRKVADLLARRVPTDGAEA